MTTEEKLRIKRKKAFLKELADERVLGNVTVACKRAKIPRATAYHYKDEDEEFSDEWDRIVLEADEMLADLAESGLVNLVLDNHPTGIIFTLKNRRPKKWKDNYEFKGEVELKQKMDGYNEWLKKIHETKKES